VKEELRKGNKRLVSLVKKWNGAAHTEKRTFKALPLLDLETNFQVWRSRFRATLAPYKLLRYVDDEVPEPQDKKSAEQFNWNTDGRDVFRLLTASITDPVWSRMVIFGWNPKDGDPHDTYCNVFDALQGRSENMNRLRTQEFFSLRPESFGMIDAYFDRICTLRQELGDDDVENNVATEIKTVLSAIKHKYPQVMERNMRKLQESVAAGKYLILGFFVRDLTLECLEDDFEQSLLRVRME
ncbi:hypothetical protein C8A05DRAFT_12462, partial [Staphylotrichum tortipilum]